MRKIIDNYYDINVTRTGLSKESSLYTEKAKGLKKIEQICLSKKIKFYFDITVRVYDYRFSLASTGTNFGMYIYFPNNRFEYYIFEQYIKNKKLIKILDIDLKEQLNISKYNQNTKYVFDKNINGVAVLPNQNRLENVDFKKVNQFMDSNSENYIKIHPVISNKFVNHLAKKYGKERLIKSNYLLEDVILKSNIVALTGNTESIIPTSLFNKKIYDIATDNLNYKNSQATYPLLYISVMNGITIQNVFETDYTGLIPWCLMENDVYISNKIDKLMSIHEQWRNSIYNCSF